MNIKLFSQKDTPTKMVPNPNYNPRAKKNKQPKFVEVPDYSGAPNVAVRSLKEGFKDSWQRPTADIEKYGRYGITYDPNEDRLDYALADAQSNLEKTWNALKQTAYGEVFLGTISGFADLTDFILGGAVRSIKGENDYTNPVSKYLDDVREEYKRNNDIYVTPDTSIKNGGLANWGWYMSNLPSVASTLTLLIPSTALAKGLSWAGKATRFANGVGKARKFLTGISKADERIRVAREAIAAGRESGRGVDLLTKARLWANNRNTIDKANRLFEYGINGFTQRVLENYQESRQTYNELLPDMLHGFVDKNGNTVEGLLDMPQDEYDEFIKQNKEILGDIDTTDRTNVAKAIAMRGADRTFTEDMGNAIFDIYQLYAIRNIRGLSNRMMNAANRRKHLNSIRYAGKTEQEVEDILSHRSKLAKAWEKTGDYLHSARKVIGAEVTEGVEEAVNYIAQQEGLTYGHALLAGEKDTSLFDKRLSDYMVAPQLWDSAFWGLMGGIVFQGFNSTFLKAKAAHQLMKQQDKDNYVDPSTGEKKAKVSWWNAFMSADGQAVGSSIDQRKKEEDEFRQKKEAIEAGKDPYNIGKSLSSDAEKKAALDRAENEFIQNLLLNSMFSGTFDITREYLQSDELSQAMANFGHGTVTTNREIQDKARTMADKIQYLYDSEMRKMGNIFRGDITSSDGERIARYEDIPVDYLQIIAAQNINHILQAEQFQKNIDDTAVDDVEQDKLDELAKQGIDYKTAVRQYVLAKEYGMVLAQIRDIEKVQEYKDGRTPTKGEYDARTVSGQAALDELRIRKRALERLLTNGVQLAPEGEANKEKKDRINKLAMFMVMKQAGLNMSKQGENYVSGTTPESINFDANLATLSQTTTDAEFKQAIETLDKDILEGQDVSLEDFKIAYNQAQVYNETLGRAFGKEVNEVLKDQAQPLLDTFVNATTNEILKEFELSRVVNDRDEILSTATRLHQQQNALRGTFVELATNSLKNIYKQYNDEWKQKYGWDLADELALGGLTERSNKRLKETLSNEDYNIYMDAIKALALDNGKITGNRYSEDNPNEELRGKLRKLNPTNKYLADYISRVLWETKQDNFAELDKADFNTLENVKNSIENQNPQNSTQNQQTGTSSASTQQANNGQRNRQKIDLTHTANGSPVSTVIPNSTYAGVITMDDEGNPTKITQYSNSIGNGKAKVILTPPNDDSDTYTVDLYDVESTDNIYNNDNRLFKVEQGVNDGGKVVKKPIIRLDDEGNIVDVVRGLIKAPGNTGSTNSRNDKDSYITAINDAATIEDIDSLINELNGKTNIPDNQKDEIRARADERRQELSTPPQQQQGPTVSANKEIYNKETFDAILKEIEDLANNDEDRTTLHNLIANFNVDADDPKFNDKLEEALDESFDLVSELNPDIKYKLRSLLATAAGTTDFVTPDEFDDADEEETDEDKEETEEPVENEPETSLIIDDDTRDLINADGEVDSTKLFKKLLRELTTAIDVARSNNVQYNEDEVIKTLRENIKLKLGSDNNVAFESGLQRAIIISRKRAGIDNNADMSDGASYSSILDANPDATDDDKVDVFGTTMSVGELQKALDEKIKNIIKYYTDSVKSDKYDNKPVISLENLLRFCNETMHDENFGKYLYDRFIEHFYSHDGEYILLEQNVDDDRVKRRILANSLRSEQAVAEERKDINGKDLGVLEYLNRLNDIENEEERKEEKRKVYEALSKLKQGDRLKITIDHRDTANGPRTFIFFQSPDDVTIGSNYAPISTAMKNGFGYHVAIRGFKYDVPINIDDINDSEIYTFFRDILLRSTDDTKELHNLITELAYINRYKNKDEYNKVFDKAQAELSKLLQEYSEFVDESKDVTDKDRLEHLLSIFTYLKTASQEELANVGQTVSSYEEAIAVARELSLKDWFKRLADSYNFNEQILSGGNVIVDSVNEGGLILTSPEDAIPINDENAIAPIHRDDMQVVVASITDPGVGYTTKVTPYGREEIDIRHMSGGSTFIGILKDDGTYALVHAYPQPIGASHFTGEVAKLNNEILNHLSNLLNEWGDDINVSTDDIYDFINKLTGGKYGARGVRTNNPLFKGIVANKLTNGYSGIQLTYKDKEGNYHNITLFDRHKNGSIASVAKIETLAKGKAQSAANPDKRKEIIKAIRDIFKEYLTYNIEFDHVANTHNLSGVATRGTNNEFIVTIGDKTFTFDSYRDFIIKNGIVSVTTKHDGISNFVKPDETNSQYERPKIQLRVETTVSEDTTPVEEEKIEGITAPRTIELTTADRIISILNDNVNNRENSNIVGERILSILLKNDELNLLKNSKIFQNLLFGNIKFVEVLEQNKNAIAAYIAKDDTIYLTRAFMTLANNDPNQAFRHLIHEMLHKKLRTLSEDEINILFKGIREIHKDFVEANASDTLGEELVNLEPFEFKDKKYRNDDDSLNDVGVEEFLVESITRPTLMNRLNDIPVSRQKGTYRNARSRNLLQKLISLLCDIFGIKINKGSLLGKEYRLFKQAGFLSGSQYASREINRNIQRTTTKEFTESSKAIDELINESDKYITRDKEHQYLINGQKVDTSVTQYVSSVFGKPNIEGNYDHSTAIGNDYDAIWRDYFDGIDVREQLEKGAYPNFNNDTSVNKSRLEEVIEDMERFKQYLTDRFGDGWKVITKEFFIAANIKDANGNDITIAGAIDMAVIDKNGDIHIFDMKTKNNRTPDMKNGEDVRDYIGQQNMYRAIMEGINPKLKGKIKSLNLIWAIGQYPRIHDARYLVDPDTNEVTIITDDGETKLADADKAFRTPRLRNNVKESIVELPIKDEVRNVPDKKDVTLKIPEATPIEYENVGAPEVKKNTEIVEDREKTQTEIIDDALSNDEYDEDDEFAGLFLSTIVDNNNVASMPVVRSRIVSEEKKHFEELVTKGAIEIIC